MAATREPGPRPPGRVRSGAGPPPPRGRWARRLRAPQVVPRAGPFLLPLSFLSPPLPLAGVGGTSPASSSLSSREGGKEPPALSCLPENFCGAPSPLAAAPPAGRCSSGCLSLRGPGPPAGGRPPASARQPRLGPSAALPRASRAAAGSPASLSARAPVGPSFPGAPPLPAGSRRQASPRRPPLPRTFLCVGCRLAPRADGGRLKGLAGPGRPPAPRAACPGHALPPEDRGARAAAPARGGRGRGRAALPLAGAGQLASPGLPAGAARRPVALRRGHLRGARGPGGRTGPPHRRAAPPPRRPARRRRALGPPPSENP